MARLTLLGPQRKDPCVADVLGELELDGPVGVITAGWEEREGEIEELCEHLGCDVLEMGLTQRTDELRRTDPALLAAHQVRSDRRTHQLEIYRLRVGNTLDTVFTLLSDDDPQRGVFSHEEAEDALRAVAALDARHVEQMRDLDEEFEALCTSGDHPQLEAAREQVGALLESCSAVTMAGGHVRRLLDALRLFGLAGRLAERPVVAWSAGAMAATERVFLFHDTPPQGRVHSSMYGPGLALAPGLVAFPHARRRLLLDDPQRVGVLARRHAPASCVCLDEGGRADWDGKAWNLHPGTRWMTTEGTLAEHAGAAS